MRNHNLTPRWAQASLACLLLIIAAGAGALTMTLNIMFGLTKHWTMAAGFALTDATKMVLPLAARRYGITPFIRNVFILCLAISVYAAFSTWLTESGQILIEAGRAEDSSAAARRAVAEADAALSRITEAGSAEALNLQVTAAKAAVADATQAAREAGITCAQRSKCSAAQAALQKALERLDQAQARDALKKQRAEALAKLEHTEEKALGAPDYVAAFFGIDRQTVARIDNVLVTLAFICALECLGVLSFLGAALLAELIAKPAEPRRPVVVTTVEPDKKAASLARLRALIRQQGHLDASRTELSEQLDVRRSTLQDWIDKWRSEGDICTGPAPGGRTRFTLPEQRATN